ncbi:T9SS type A sorting domain-containing protein [Flavobacterium sp.]|uniref:T9SS type A sorting domain-containing protein n=1 Tax=Flavobacterium sp. TaxID=239 RepID=UPI00403375B2
MKLKITLLSALFCSALGYSQAEFVNTGFGNNGVTCVDIPGLTIKMADIKKINDTYYGLTNFTNISLVKLSSNGDLISSFGNNGYLPMNIGPTGGSVYGKDSDILITPNNELILVTTPSGIIQDNFMTKTDLNGTIITSFGNNGSIPNWNSDFIYYMSAELINNEIVLVGAGAIITDPQNIQRYIFVRKYDIDGEPVSSFGNNGSITAPIDNFVSPNGAHYFQDTNRVAIIANYFDNVQYHGIIAMYDMNNGIADPAFGTGGFINLYPTGDTTIYPMVLHCDNNNIYVSGRISTPPVETLFVRKMDLTGQPDLTFGSGDGIYERTIGNTPFRYVSSINETQGKFTITGALSYEGTDYDKIFLLRLNENGTEDTGFGNNGMIVNPMDLAHIGTGYATLIEEHHITVATLSLECTSDDQPKPAVVQFLAETELNNEQHLASVHCLYPNPVKDILNFTAPIEKAEVYDLTGKLVISKNSTANSIDLSQLQKGLYMVRVSQNGVITNNKIIKE